MNLETGDLGLTDKRMKRQVTSPNRHVKSIVLALLIGVTGTLVPLSNISAQGGLPLKAPEASFSIEGREYSISEFENRRLMLWFLSTWCAWDTLFIPELLNATVTVSSACGETDDVVKLTVSPSGIQSVEPVDAVVSFLIPDEDELRENVTASFCHFVYFFRSREDGEAWVSEHDGTFLLSLEEAFTVGQKMNAARFNETLKK